MKQLTPNIVARDSVEIDKSIDTSWHGVQEFYIKDPSGYILAFAQQMS